MNKNKDQIFFSITIALLITGIFVFISASLGVLARNEAKFYSILLNQLVLGLCLGVCAMIFFSRFNYKILRKYSFYIFLVAILGTLLVFVPGLGFEHGGARRWIDLRFFSFQPVEFLKIAFLIYFSAWLSYFRGKGSDLKVAILPFICLMGIIAVILIKQPDTKSLVLIFISALAMMFVYGISWRYIVGAFIALIIGVAIITFFKPYIIQRFETFLNPSLDPRGASYQLKQSLIAIGSGGVLGRGLGQSVQKFQYLPEPQGDSIFAVVGEEFGFVGSVIIILLYLAFAMRGLKIARSTDDIFGRLLCTGIVIMITAQSFLNIGSITGVIPLTGVPLVFMSQGGTSLFFALIGVGIVLQISKYQKKA